MKLRLPLLLLCAVTAAIGADASGKWVAEIPGRGGAAASSTFTFKVSGSKLEGTVATARGDTPISDGKIEGDAISFTVVRNRGGQDVKIQYKGVVTGDTLKLDISNAASGATTTVAAKHCPPNTGCQ